MTHILQAKFIGYPRGIPRVNLEWGPAQPSLLSFFFFIFPIYELSICVLNGGIEVNLVLCFPLTNYVSLLICSGNKAKTNLNQHFFNFQYVQRK